MNGIHSVKVARVCARSRDARGTRSGVTARRRDPNLPNTHSQEHTHSHSSVCVSPQICGLKLRVSSDRSNERERGSARRMNKERNIRVSSDVWRLLSVWKTDGFIKWLNLFVLFAFSLSYWVSLNVEKLWKSVPRASALFLNSLSRSFFKKGLETLY